MHTLVTSRKQFYIVYVKHADISGENIICCRGVPTYRKVCYQLRKSECKTLNIAFRNGKTFKRFNFFKQI